MLPRVTFVTDIVTPYAVAVFSALAERCRLTVVFCSRSGSRGLAWEFPDELQFSHRVLPGATLGRRTPDATDIYPDPRIFTAVARSRPDAIISGGFSLPSLYAAAYARLTGKLLLIHSDGTHDSERRIGVAQRVLRRFFARVSDGAIGNSVPAVRRFVELGWSPEHVYLAPHSTNIAGFHDVGRRRSYEGTRPLSFLCVTRLIPRKGVDRLIRAAAAAREQGADISLAIAGTGSDEPALRRQAEEARTPVEWLGLVEHERLPPIYERADAFVFPTLMDPFGIALLEAAAAGLPLLASPHGGATQDFVRDEVNGLVVDPDDVDALAAALVRLAADGELRRRLGRAAFASTSDRTPDATARAYVDAVDAAIAS
jgi:glycosyltransferase involved in cell wall biosynthesis